MSNRAWLNCRICHLALLCWFISVFRGSEKGPFIGAAKRIRLFSAQLSSAQLWPQAGLFKWLHWSVKRRCLHSMVEYNGAASSLFEEDDQTSLFKMADFDVLDLRKSHSLNNFLFCLLKVFLFGVNSGDCLI